MTDLYIESFFQKGTGSLTPRTENPSLPAISEESINQVHFLLRILKEELYKSVQDTPPFPLILKKLEAALLSKSDTQTLDLINDFEELLDIKFLSHC